MFLSIAVSDTTVPRKNTYYSATAECRNKRGLRNVRSHERVRFVMQPHVCLTPLVTQEPQDILESKTDEQYVGRVSSWH